jgi:hypothetical protein
VAELFFSATPIPWETQEEAAGGLEPAHRTGTLRLGSERLWGRIDFQNLPGGSTVVLRLRDPRGALVAEGTLPSSSPSLIRYDLQRFEIEERFDRPGRWTLEVVVNDALAALAPLRVVKGAGAARNRPPVRVRAAFAQAPVDGQVATCMVESPLVHEDPDYDLVRYLYRWQAGSRVVRTVTTAALADHLRRDLVRRGEQLTCRVTPHDGRRAGPTAQVRARVRP